MKKYLLLIVALFSFCAFNDSATKQKVDIDISKNGNKGTNMDVKRAPMRLPINVIYDEDMNLLG